MVMYESLRPGDLQVEDKPEESTLHKAMERLGPAAAGTVRLVDRRDFYSAHGQDAVWMASHFYKTNSILKYYGAKNGAPGTPYCTFSVAVACSFLREALTTKQLRVQIYVKDGNKVRLDKQASPGNLQDVEAMIFDNVENLSSPIVAAVYFQIKASIVTVGVAFADSSSREIGISQFLDNELFSNLESLIIQLGVKEILLEEDEKQKSPEATKLRTIIERCGVVLTNRSKAEFKDTDIEQDLTRLVQETDKAQLEGHFPNKESMSACAALISYLSLNSDDSNAGAFRLIKHDLAHYMRLDASAVKALHLMPETSGIGGANKNSSVFGVLNRCKTAQGTRLLAQWLKQPLVNLHEIETRQALVQCMVNDTFLRQTLQDDHLKSVPDLTRLVKKLTRGTANLQDVARIYQAVLGLRGIVECLRTAGSDNVDETQKTAIEEQYVEPLADFEAKLQPYAEMVETTLDLEELDNNKYVIRAEFSEELQSIKEQLEGLTAQFDEEYEKVADDLNMATDGKTLHFERSGTHGHCFRLTRKEASILSQGDRKSKYTQLSTIKAGTYFITKTLRKLREEYTDLENKYNKKQAGLVKEVVAIAASYCEVLLPLNNLLAHLDVIVSLAHVAINAPTPYVKPTITHMGKGDLILSESRHPCLEMQDDINFIPNDAELKREKSDFVILTGPNMGGKSTYIRQVAVVALMAQIGSFVPCTEAQLPIFDCILARVGAGDYQMRGVSTFMVEMMEIATILKTATNNSLIIIDELGRGTSVQDGFGLAWAISEHIATDVQAFCLFASHFHELCSLSEQINRVKNLHVVAAVEENANSLTGRDVTLLYKVEPGSSDRSFGIAVAELARFPPEVIKLAKRKADDLEAFETAVPKEADQCSPEEVAEGTNLLRGMLVEWAKSLPPQDPDVDMDGNSAPEAQADKELALLKECLAAHQESLQGNRWLQALMKVN